MRKIVIVDDVDDNSEFLSFILRDRYEVTRYASGEETLRNLAVDRPDLVILDITLPDMSGFEVLNAIRREPQFETVPVIAVTAHAMLGDRERCLNAGFTDYVSKPILDVPEFLANIEKLTGGGA